MHPKCLKIFQSIVKQSQFVSKQLLSKRSNFYFTRQKTMYDLFNKSKQNHTHQHSSSQFQKKYLTPNFVFLIVLNSLKNIPDFFKVHSVKIVQNCAQNCEYVLAHRLRRIQQMLTLYSKLWDERTFQHFVNTLKAQLRCDKTLYFLSASLFYNWNKERIPDEDILRYSAEMSLIEFLRDKRKACLKGSKRPADCACPVCTETDSEWQSFVEKDDIVVWKREDVNHRGKGLYCYKMYARYEDVTAYDFLEAQTDLDYRRSWDTHAVQLKLIDSEPQTNSDVIYWETKWPQEMCRRPRPLASDYHFFRYLKRFPGGQQFDTDEDLETAVKGWLSSQAAEFYDTGIQILVYRYDK